MENLSTSQRLESVVFSSMKLDAPSRRLVSLHWYSSASLATIQNIRMEVLTRMGQPYVTSAWYAAFSEGALNHFILFFQTLAGNDAGKTLHELPFVPIRMEFNLRVFATTSGRKGAFDSILARLQTLTRLGANQQVHALFRDVMTTQEYLNAIRSSGGNFIARPQNTNTNARINELESRLSQLEQIVQMLVSIAPPANPPLNHRTFQ
jgi:hypothetical protein